MTQCKDCNHEWSGMAEHHCTVCHEQFGSDSAWDRHWCDSTTTTRTRHRAWCDASRDAHRDARGDWRPAHFHPSEVPGLALYDDGRWRSDARREAFAVDP